MSATYCRAAIIKNTLRTTHITCTCGATVNGSHYTARRRYYAHNPNSIAIPGPHTHYAPLSTERPPSDDELRELQREIINTRRTEFPEIHDRAISRCTACGDWKWRGKCRVAGCWTNLDLTSKEHAA